MTLSGSFSPLQFDNVSRPGKIPRQGAGCDEAFLALNYDKAEG